MLQLLGDTVAHSAESQAIAIVFGALVIGGFTIFVRWLKKHVVTPLQEVPAIVQRQEQMAHDLTGVLTDVAAVVSEVHANHGSSLRDSTNRNEVLTRKLCEHIGVDPDELVPPMPT